MQTNKVIGLSEGSPPDNWKPTVYHVERIKGEDMDKEKIFANGMIFKEPRDEAPDFVKGTLSIKLEEFLPFLNQHQNNGWVNIDLKVSLGGKPYAELNNWKPDSSKSSQPASNNGVYGSANDSGPGSFEDDIPF